MDEELTPIIEAGSQVEVYLDAADGTMQIGGRITHPFDGTQDAVIVTRARRTRIIPAGRILYVEDVPEERVHGD